MRILNRKAAQNLGGLFSPILTIRSLNCFNSNKKGASGAERNVKSSGAKAVDGDSLSYTDMMEHATEEEKRKAREKAIVEEGKALWQEKKNEQLEQEIRDLEEVCRQKT